MTPLQVKTFIWKNNLSISSMAREIELEYDATADSIRVMLNRLFFDGVYNAKLAELVNEKYGLKIDRPRSKSLRKAA